MDTLTQVSSASDDAIERHKDLARRFVERALGMGDMAAFDEIVAEDVVVHTGLKPTGSIRGKAEYKRVLAETLGRVFSDGEMAVDDVAATADGRLSPPSSFAWRAAWRRRAPWPLSVPSWWALMMPSSPPLERHGIEASSTSTKPRSSAPSPSGAAMAARIFRNNSQAVV